MGVNVEDYKISAAFLRGYLAGLRKVAGTPYPKLLEKSGLGQYIHKYPPLSLEQVATGKELILLQQEALKILGADLFQLFLKNVGREYGKTAAKYPYIIEHFSKLEKIKTPEEFLNAINIFVQASQTALSAPMETQLSKDGKNVIMTYVNCMLCAGLATENPDRPFCGFMEASTKETLQIVLKVRLQVQEIRCAAMHRQTGETDCQFLISNPF